MIPKYNEVSISEPISISSVYIFVDIGNLLKSCILLIFLNYIMAGTGLELWRLTPLSTMQLKNGNDEYI